MEKITFKNFPYKTTPLNDANLNQLQTNVENAIDDKVDKVSGKGLSTNDYTTTEKNKLAGIEPGANNYVHPSTHNADMIIEDTTHRFVTDTERTKLAGIADNANNYSLPTATDLVLGGVKVGTRLSITDGVLSADDQSTTILNLVYPVGSIYLSVNNTNPGTLFGGTWVAWGTGRVPVGINTGDSDFNTVEKTGGAKTHVLSEAQIPNHVHKGIYWSTKRISLNNGSVGYQLGWSSGGADDATVLSTGATGGGQAHPNLQPYITCYMWKRTS